MMLFGCGINIISYCCNACADFGVSNYEYVSCDQVHHDHQDEFHQDCCSHKQNEEHRAMGFDELCNHLQTSHTHCSLKRISLEEFSSQARSFNSNPNVQYITLQIEEMCLSLTAPKVSAVAQIYPPPIASSRDILAKHAVLII